MGLRITTWNVNGIRNPFGYQPWRDKRTFSAMFDILEADIVVMQETKIQRKDLRDDMVLVDGWDVYFSLPKYKKGYSGVAIYTRNAVCAPIRAEEGITGILTPPNTSTSFCDLPAEQQIGGYPTPGQLAGPLDAATLDSEGRCVILEFPAIVLIGVYNPANRDETRDDFRVGFLNALDARVRNLVALGKRVFLTGDLNIIRDELDTANAAEQLRKHDMTIEEYISTPARRILNQLLKDGKVIGDRDEGREKPVLWDICRTFHPNRKGMFTCWEQKINARPGNFGSRIDYVLCSLDCVDWFEDSNIQEGLLGSDHCPVYAVIKDKVAIDGKEVHIQDVMNPKGVFEGGIRKRDWTSKDSLPMSAKLIPEFHRRRSIRDMFVKRPSLPSGDSSFELSTKRQGAQVAESTSLCSGSSTQAAGDDSDTVYEPPSRTEMEASSATEDSTTLALSMRDAVPVSQSYKRPMSLPSAVPPQKRGKLGLSTSSSKTSKTQLAKGQSSLKGFFKPKTLTSADVPTSVCHAETSHVQDGQISISTGENAFPKRASPKKQRPADSQSIAPRTHIDETDSSNTMPLEDYEQNTVVDPIVTKETWEKLLSKRVAPKCEHNEPCISYLTKKPGINCGRSFYICPRPLGPSGVKERGTEWRCGTFIWSSDWTGEVTSG